MRPKDSTTDIIRLTNNLRNYLSYSTDKEEQLEYLDEYTEFISEFLTEFRNDRVYITDMPVARILHPEGARRLMVDLDPNLVDTPKEWFTTTMSQYMHNFERLKEVVRMELDLNREVFIYNIYPFRHMDADGEIRYRPIIRWSKLPMEIWYNDLSSGPFMIIKKIKKHEL
jgi:hypothetical protein